MKVINDLFDYDGMKIVQNQDYFKFSIDSVLLAEFIEIKNDQQVIVDFCTGNSPIPLILSTKYKNLIKGIEIQKEIYELGLESVKINKKENQINLINDNINNIKKHFENETVDIVSCNPPYFKLDEFSYINENVTKSIARHEIECSLEDIIRNAAYILKNKGNFYMVHRPERIEEVIEILNKCNFKVKKLQFIYANYDKNAIMVLINAVKNGKSGAKVLKPIYINEHNSYQDIVGE